MPTEMPPLSRQPQLGDNDYDIAAFGRELFGGSLRWPATVFAVVAALFVICIVTGLLPSDMYWPVRARGATATVIAVALLVFWSVMAVINWRSRWRGARRRAHSLGGGPAPR